MARIKISPSASWVMKKLVTECNFLLIPIVIITMILPTINNKIIGVPLGPSLPSLTMLFYKVRTKRVMDQ